MIPGATCACRPEPNCLQVFNEVVPHSETLLSHLEQCLKKAVPWTDWGPRQLGKAEIGAVDEMGSNESSTVPEIAVESVGEPSPGSRLPEVQPELGGCLVCGEHIPIQDLALHTNQCLNKQEREQRTLQEDAASTRFIDRLHEKEERVLEDKSRKIARISAKKRRRKSRRRRIVIDSDVSEPNDDLTNGKDFLPENAGNDPFAFDDNDAEVFEPVSPAKKRHRRPRRKRRVYRERVMRISASSSEEPMCESRGHVSKC